jgi:tetratricopeptide (TPR) repeat protein
MNKKTKSLELQSEPLLNETGFFLDSAKYILPLFVLVSVVFLVLTLKESYSLDKSFGFPLDDPWIHLQFAKNLNAYGTFSYYKDEMVTAGSTAPFYTFLLAAGFFITKNEFILSYSLGIIFLIGSALIFYRIVKSNLNESKLFGLAGAFLLLFEPRLQWASLSGMETTLAIFLLILTAYAYQNKSSVLLGIAAGLLIWVRPEALIFIGCIILDLVYNQFIVPKEVNKKEIRQGGNNKWFLSSMIIFGILIFFYFGFNLILSGNLFPNTLAAKIKYYSGSKIDYWNPLIKYLAGGHFLVLSLFVVIGSLGVFKNIFSRRADPNFLFFTWIVGLTVAFSIYLPKLYQNGRYIIPVIPFIILISLRGMDMSFRLLKEYIIKRQNATIYRSIALSFLVVISVQFVLASIDGIKEYSDTCRYINDRQVTTAKWLNANLPKDAVIATHDIGAIGFYSERRIVDMVGLVSPDMIPSIGSFDALENFLNEKKVTHLVVLRNWFHLGNQKTIYETDERYPEVMEVFDYRPSSVMFVPQNVTRMNETAQYYLSIGDVQQAGAVLNQSLEIFPRLAWTHFLVGQAYLLINNPAKAGESFKNALLLDSTYTNAKEAIKQLER